MPTERKLERLLKRLPEKIQVIARHAVENHEFRHYRKKKLKPAGKLRDESVSIRVTHTYRAIGQRDGDGAIHWYWVGTHAEYDRITK